MQLLTKDDRLEIGLRHLGAHFYEQRTRDRVGVSHMRVFATPGVSRDVRRTWMVQEVTTQSKSECQRNDRVESEISGRAKGEGKDKGKKK